MRTSDDELKLRNELYDSMRGNKPSDQRYPRAVRFVDLVMFLMRDFVPHDRECQRRMRDELLLAAFADRLNVINTPPERDALDKLQLQRAMYEKKFAHLSVSEIAMGYGQK
jgi:hypothetical protein